MIGEQGQRLRGRNLPALGRRKREKADAACVSVTCPHQKQTAHSACTMTSGRNFWQGESRRRRSPLSMTPIRMCAKRNYFPKSGRGAGRILMAAVRLRWRRHECCRTGSLPVTTWTARGVHGIWSRERAGPSGREIRTRK